MPSPATPKEDAILDRIVAVLAAITAGATYWFTPGEVSKRFKHWQEITSSFPVYMVNLTSENTPVHNAGKNVDRLYSYSVKGYVRDDNDTQEFIIKCVSDIRLALTTEMENGAVGSLPSLGVIRLGPTQLTDTDDGYLALEGFGFFTVDVPVLINDVTGYV